MEDVPYEVRPPPPEVQFETLSPSRRVLKRVVTNPFGNYAPAGLLRWLLRLGKSEMAAASWGDPGGWRSMVICYSGNCPQIADKILVNAGTMPMALRNRKRLASYLIARLIEQAEAESAHVLCLGGGPGWIIMDAIDQARAPAHATMVDISAEALEFGGKLAAERGLADRMTYIQADACDVGEYLREPPHMVKMVGICEYLDNEQIVAIARAASDVMPAGSAIVSNSLSRAHGTDRFLRRVFGVRMRHRSPGDICRLLGQSRFGDFAVHPEPLGVYHVIVGRRLADGRGE